MINETNAGHCDCCGAWSDAREVVPDIEWSPGLREALGLDAVTDPVMNRAERRAAERRMRRRKR